jgi:PadR family transcriptional regulator PadR
VSKPSDLVQGTLDMLILKILALEPLNGWAISQRLKRISSDVLGVSDGSLYPALHKLEYRGWIRAQWKSSENNRRAEFYSLTQLGRKQLAQETVNWNRVSPFTMNLTLSFCPSSFRSRKKSLLSVTSTTALSGPSSMTS